MPTVKAKPGQKASTPLTPSKNGEKAKVTKIGAKVTKPKNKEAAEPSTKDRPILYATIKSAICRDDKAITQEKAKQLLGWKEEDKKQPYKERYDLQHDGVKIRLTNNVHNRPIYSGTLATLQQEHLRKRWRFNGEPIIVGQTGQILNGQHTLISFVQAVDEWRKNPDNYPLWEDVPTLEKLIVYGIEEDDQTVNTMDTCKPRSLSDVIYRADYFKGLSANKQRITAKMADNAIRMLWHCMGHHDAFSVRRTHAEAIDFLERHRTLLKAVRHIFEEDGDGKIKRILSPGYASAALYLMSVNNSDGEAYFSSEIPSEKDLDTSDWEKACEFFVKIAAEDKALLPVKLAISKLLEEGLGRLADRWVVIVKAWNLYLAGKKLTIENVYPKFEVKDGVKQLAEHPLIGGIDIGDEGATAPSTKDPSPEEIAEKTSKLRGGAKKAKRAGATWAAGDTAWVHEEGEEPVFGTLSDDPYDCYDDKQRVLVDTPDGNFEFEVGQLSLNQFELQT